MKNTNKLYRIIIFSISALFLTAGLSTVKAEEVKEGIIASSNGLNVRTEASLKSKITSVLNNGTKVKLLGETDNWYKIQVGTGYGYIYKEFVKLDSQNANISEETSETLSYTTDNSKTQPQSETTAETKCTSATVLSQTGLNLREEASIKSKILKLLKPGTNVEILETANMWCKVKVDDLTGYVSKQYLKLDATEKQTSTTSASTAFAKTKTGKGTVLTNNGLNLRKEASLKSDIITTIKPKTIVNVIEETGDWYKLKTDNLEGYALKKFIKLE